MDRLVRLLYPREARVTIDCPQQRSEPPAGSGSIKAYISGHHSIYTLHLLVFLFDALPFQRAWESSAAVVRSVREGVEKGLIHDCRRCNRGDPSDDTIPKLAGLARMGLRDVSMHKAGIPFEFPLQRSERSFPNVSQ